MISLVRPPDASDAIKVLMASKESVLIILWIIPITFGPATNCESIKKSLATA